MASIKATRLWIVLYWTLWAFVVLTAGLNMLRVRAGFLTSYTADLVVPALLYVMMRGLAEPERRPTLVQRWFGGTPERTASVLFLASSATEWTQRYWPRGLFPGRFDPWDIAAFAVGIAICYACDRAGLAWPRET